MTYRPTILTGDALAVLDMLPDGYAQMCVTSPPYFGLRDYGCAGQMGLEPTPDEYISGMVRVFREVRRVLADDGTLWLNIGDSYAGSGRGAQGESGQMADRSVAQHRGSQLHAGFHESVRAAGGVGRAWVPPPTGLKQKDLIGIPWMLAFALRADGWYLRQDIIWSKPNPMPESVTDRCTKAHEYVFLLSKSRRYYFDAEAVAEPVAAATIARLSQPNLDAQAGSLRVPGKTNGAMKASAPRFGGVKYGDDPAEMHRTKSGNVYEVGPGATRNRRSVWTIATQPFKEAHFATFPSKLIEPCILAGCPEGGIVLDPFGGSGTTGMVAQRLGRRSTLIELNPDYVAIARRRCAA